MVRPVSWRDLPRINPAAGARLRDGYGLGAWRSVVPARNLRTSATSRSRSGKGDGRGQPNELERIIAREALKDEGSGDSIWNLGGRALLQGLDALDTPGAFVRSGIIEAAQALSPEEGEGGTASWRDFTRQGWDNVSGQEMLRLDEYDLPAAVDIGLGFAADVATDPLTFVAGSAARVGTEAGETAARKFLTPQVKEHLGTAAVEAQERAGRTFTKATRQAEIAAQGEVLAARAAQKAAKFRSNQALSPIEREAIGAEPGTFLNIPGKKLKIDKMVERVAPARVVEGRSGNSVFRLTKRELGLGRAAGKARARVTQGRFGNWMAQNFTKYPELRTKMLFGTPDEAAVAIQTLTKRRGADLQTRLFEVQFGGEMEGLLHRAKKAGVDGEDLRYAVAETLGDEGAEALGPATSRVMAQATRRGDDSLVQDMRQFFKKVEDHANAIDPELPWLQHRDNYTTRLPADEMIALRGGYGNAGGALRKDVFDFKRMYGPKTPENPDAIDTLFGQKLVDPSQAGGRAVEQQIDDILDAAGARSMFERDAYKSFPDYVRRMSRRYGDEWLAKGLRDLGIAEPAMIRQLTEAGVKQGKIKTAVFKLTLRASLRASRATRAAGEAGVIEQTAARGTSAARQGVQRARKSAAERTAERDVLQRMVDALDPDAVVEYGAELQEAAATIHLKRQGLLDQVGIAEDELFKLDHALVEASHRLNLETYQATQRVTRLESALTKMYDELGELHEKVRMLSGQTDYRAARTHLDDLISRAEARANKIADADGKGFGPNAFDKVAEQLDSYRALTRDNVAFRQWADKQKNLGRYKSDLFIAKQTADELQNVEDQIAEVMGKIGQAEATLHEFEDLAAMPTDHLDAQLADVDAKLRTAVDEYDTMQSQQAKNKIEALGNVKASVLHEKGVIERARARVAGVDAEGPSLVATLDSLHDTEAMGERIIHSVLPDLPEEVQGSRLMGYFQDRMDDLQQQVDGTQGQILSAYADRDTMRVELSKIRENKRAAARNLKQVAKDIEPKQRTLWQQEQEMLEQADIALQRAIEIDDEIAQGAAAIGQMNDQIAQDQLADSVAERYMNVMHARQLKYEADRLATEATASEARKTADFWRDLARREMSKEQETALQLAMKANFQQIGAVSQTRHDWMVEALRAATIMQGPAGIRPALRVFDRVQNLWKAYALSTPGTVIRNIYGGVFNNWLSTEPVTALDYELTMRWMFRRRDNLKPAERAIFEQIEEAGLMTGSATTLEIERSMRGASFNPGSTDFVWTRFFRKGQEHGEGLVRGALAYRTLARGGTIDDAIANTMKYHFNYDDLSALERSFLRRMVPFYTWTRKNFPLMLEQIVQNPQKFARFYQLKTEIEEQSPEEAIIPGYFTENLATRLPFSMGLGQAYMLPDLPFMSLNDVTDPTVAASQVTPFVKTPIEYIFGKQFFKGIPLRDDYTSVPSALQVVPGVMPTLGAMGIAERGPEGWMMRQKDLYVLESGIPVFGRARRLFPSEEKFDARVMTSWASVMFGAGLRANTPQEQRNAAFSRVAPALDRYDRYEQLGYFDEDTKLPRFGQTINAAYQELGVAE